MTQFSDHHAAILKAAHDLINETISKNPPTISTRMVARRAGLAPRDAGKIGRVLAKNGFVFVCRRNETGLYRYIENGGEK